MESLSQAGAGAGPLIGSTIDTKRVDGVPWYWETSDYAPGESKGSDKIGFIEHKLLETGTYTLLAGGSAASTAEGERWRARRDPVGGYYLQLNHVGNGNDTLPLYCPKPPPGSERKGCANYQWSVFTGSARMAKRHPNCLQQYPQSSPVGSHVDQNGVRTINDLQATTSGTYTLRVRGLINNCFRAYVGKYWCSPEAGPFDIKAKVTDSPSYSPPSLPSLPTEPASSHRVSISMGGQTSIASVCAAGGGNSDLCWQWSREPKKCSSSYDNYDMGVEEWKLHGHEHTAHTEASFSGTKDTIVCITAERTEGGSGKSPGERMELIGPDGKVHTFTLGSVGSQGSCQDQYSYDLGIDPCKGLGITAYNLTQSGTYVIKLYDWTTGGMGPNDDGIPAFKGTVLKVRRHRSR